MRNFIAQSSTDTPLVLFVYESDRAKSMLNVEATDVVDDGIEFLLYPDYRHSPVEDRRHTPHIYLVDLKTMASNAIPFLENYTNLHKQAASLGLTRPTDIDRVKKTNAADDSR